MKIIHNKGSFDSYIHSYQKIFLKSLLSRKWLNMSLMAMEFLRRKTEPSAYPIIAKLETSGICNLRCPYCAHGAAPDKIINTERRIMSMDTFYLILETLHRYSILFFLHHRGDPMVVHDSLLKMAFAAYKKNVATAISTNLSFNLKKDYFDDIVESKLTHITVSLDGVSQEVYEKYRIGGRVDLVIHNISEIMSARKKLNSKTPVIEWQFIKFDHNVHELEKAKETARKLNVDHFTIMRNKDELTCTDYTLGAKAIEQKKIGKFPFVCKWLWSTVLFLYDGEVVPCCYYNWLEKKHFGNINQIKFDDIWFGMKYNENRRCVTNQLNGTGAKEYYCRRCPLI